MKSKKYIAFLMILFAGIAWGCIGIFVRQLNANGLNSMDVVAVRSVFTCICMGIYLLVTDRTKFRIKAKDLWCFFGTGICSIVFFNACYFKTIELTSLSVAAVLLYTAPVMVMLMSAVLFREKITVVKIISMILTICGTTLVTGVLEDGGGIGLKGVLYGLGAGLGYALYSIFGRYALNKGYHTLTITFYTFLFATIGTLLLANDAKIVETVAQNKSLLLWGLALAVFSTCLPYLTYNLGLKHVENSKASIIASVEPVTATLLGFFLYNEKIGIINGVGILLVLVAIAVSGLGSGEKKGVGE